MVIDFEKGIIKFKPGEKFLLIHYKDGGNGVIVNESQNMTVHDACLFHKFCDVYINQAWFSGAKTERVGSEQEIKIKH